MHNVDRRCRCQPGSRAGRPGARGVGWLRSFLPRAGGTSKRQVLQEPSRESRFDLRTWRQRAAQRAWFCLGQGKASIVYTVIASRRLFLRVILPQRRHPGTRRRAEREAAYPGPMPVAGKRDGVGDAWTPPSFSVVPPFDIGRGMDPGSAPPLRSGFARDDEGEGVGARVKRGRRKGTGGRNVLPGASPPPCHQLCPPASPCVLRGSLGSRLRMRSVE